MSRHPDSPETCPDRPDRVRSFALRTGRLTKGQRRALEKLLPVYGVPDTPERLEPEALCGRRAPLGMEIGIGGGEAVMALARNHPDWDWLGLDVYAPGLGKLLLRLEQEPLPNLRVAKTDAVAFLEERLPAGSMDAVYIFFPDPWPKARHHKRRLIQASFLGVLASRMRPGADLFLATDWPDYAQWMVEVLEADPHFANVHGCGAWAPRCPDRPPTKFEERGEGRGHEVFDLHYRLEGGE
ncbi:tRNA (guanosine(46)-N7)-methyltransferase TrmB [Thiohalorhabdus sp.]|uniref:tRNA (guanosine(46)-N7)-methyltransferase TrmB n=1 Tax=Thiohalorhabdus sp. TaxID=3094134 RepID=UPI002FC3DBB1